MLETLAPQPADAILKLMGQFRADTRPGKIDLGVGVYKDASGNTPVMRSVRSAERRLVETQTTKTYTGLAGEPDFHRAIAGLVFGSSPPFDRLSAIATPGGTGAIRQGFELIRHAAPGATVWVSDPTWPNHLSILGYLGIPSRSYRYFDPVTKGVDFAGMMDDLEGAGPGDVVLLHGCCHNPTGADPSLGQWERIADLLARRRAVPFVDLAYLGFGDGLEADAAGTRLIASRLPEVMIAVSCSKNFGIYRERTGILFALSSPAARDTTQGALAWLNRANYSFPPDHGARVVTMILGDASLRAEWERELDEIRSAVTGLRQALAGELRKLTNSDCFDFLIRHKGMFSRLGASPEQVERLKDEFGIYMVGDSRVNIAGLDPETVPVLARALLAVGA
jgi:aromatic-amino-acid transaminase